MAYLRKNWGLLLYAALWFVSWQALGDPNLNFVFVALLMAWAAGRWYKRPE